VVAGVTIAAAAPGRGRHGEDGRTRKLRGLIMLRLRRGSPNASLNEFLPPPLSPPADQILLNGTRKIENVCETDF
jgi:hypothetical protein